MNKLIDTLLLLALPASGKSEVRRYLSTLAPAQCREEFYMGPTVQLDDFPYVHFMRRIDEELAKLGQNTLFFVQNDKPFRDPIEWGTLIALLNEDYADLHTGAISSGVSPARLLFDRLERARKSVGGQAKISILSTTIQEQLAATLEKEASDIMQGRFAGLPSVKSGDRTIVIEFARGGADGSAMPLPEPFGYQYSISLLSDEILSRAAVLYIWVTPEESRRKNSARADPNDPGSILHHGVPIEVMMKDYGCDDMDYLIQQSDRPNTLRINARGRTYYLPVARFDNRIDKTSFIRNDVSQWEPDQVKAIHTGLAEAFAKIYRAL